MSATPTKVAPYEDLVRSVKVCEREDISMDWNNISEDVRWWVGGNFDGDGCVGLYKATNLAVVIGKAENAWHVLDRLQELFGGSIHLFHQETETHQAAKNWKLIGRSAVEFCKVMQKYTLFKRPQLALAATHPIDDLRIMIWKPVMATDPRTGAETMYPNMWDAAQKLPRVTVCAIVKCARGDKHYNTCGGFKWQKLENPVKRTEVRDRVKNIAKGLKQLKKVEHEETDMEMPLPFVAGLIDSDGTMSVTKFGKVRVSLCQKYPAMCNALQRQFGGAVRRRVTILETGSVRKEKIIWNWYGNSKSPQALKAIYPFLIEKKAQAVLLLQATHETALTVSAQASALKGRQQFKKLIPLLIES